MFLKLALLPVLFGQIGFDLFYSDFGPAAVQGNKVVFTQADEVGNEAVGNGSMLLSSLDIDLYPPGRWRVIIGGEARVSEKGDTEHQLYAENFFSLGYTEVIQPTATGPWLYDSFKLPIVDSLELHSFLFVNEPSEGLPHRMSVDRLELEFLGEYIDGDYNMNGKVDAADYVVWRRGFKDGIATSLDYLAWKRNYGRMAMSQMAVTSPEPGTLFLSLILLALVATRRVRVNG